MNKKFFKGFVLAAAVGLMITMSVISASARRTVEYPWINFATGATLDIVKVEMTDTNTVLSINAHYIPKYWIRIVSDSYLLADGKKYAMTGTEGIKPDTEFWMPESGEADFKLIFEPLPESTEEFDFIEGDNPRAFRVMGVELNDGTKTVAFPKGFVADVKDGEVPAPLLKIGETTINYHLVPYRTDLGIEMTVYINNIAGQQDEFVLKPDDNGNVSFSFDQYATAWIYTVIGLRGGSKNSVKMTVQPGETIDCYIDTRLTGSYAMSHRKGFSYDNYTRLVHNGIYSDLDRMIEKHPKGYRLNLYTGEFADYHMTGEEYKNMVKSRYNAYADSIKNSDVPAMVKEYEMIDLQNDVLAAMSSYKYFLSHNYRNVKEDWRSPVPADSIPGELTDKDYAEAATWFDISNPKLLLCGNHVGGTDWNSYGVKGDLSRSVKLYSEMVDKAKNQKLEQADIDTLKSLSDPFFAAACDSIQQRSIRKYQSLVSSGVSVTPTPEVTDSMVFDSIVEQYKGKVVVVDLWNTWCGPCRAALKYNEPLKSGELNNDDIVWIYIADESSDPVKYLELIQEIKGIHYKVNEDQMDAIRTRFNVDGIPFYILVDRDGNAEGRPDLRETNSYLNVIKSKL